MALAPASIARRAVSLFSPPSTSMTWLSPARVADSAQTAYFWQHLRQELLTAKTGINGHDKNNVAEMKNVFDHLDRRRGIKHDAGLFAEAADLRQHGMQMGRRRRLSGHQQMIGASFGKRPRGSVPARQSSNAR